MSAKLTLALRLSRHFGLRWLAYRLLYLVQRRTGVLRRQLPASTWADHQLRTALSEPTLSEPQAYYDYRRLQAPAFLFDPADRTHYQAYFAKWDHTEITPTIIAEDIGQGRLRYFEHTRGQAGYPPDWFSNPFTGQRAPAERHWSQIDDFGHGDIKVIWEPSRFSFTFALVRAYWRSGDDRYADLFWQLVEDWRLQNPPQRGPNWKCGQETSIRLMAWCFGLYGFFMARPSTAERIALLAQMIVVSAERVEANLAYALSQQNNHSISEATGLYTVGTLFPEFHGAQRWRENGRQLLERLGRELIYEDGAFVQHSVNYHRLMLQLYLWVLRLADVNQEGFSDELQTRVRTGASLLYQLQDEQSGRLPCYGQNDGALLLPLANCDYQDFRPAIQAAHYRGMGTRCYNDGPWDEELLWLFGPKALSAPVVAPPRADLTANVGGYYTRRTCSGFAFVRCATFRHRPAQADMLHADIWWRGHNIALDAGTYSYNAPAPWNNALSHTVYHNTVSVDGLDQMDAAGKFLWLPWLHGRVRKSRRSAAGQISYWEGEHDGYERLPEPVAHSRALVGLGDGWWLIVDSLWSRQRHTYRLHWLLPDLPYEWDASDRELTLHTDVGDYQVRLGASHCGEASLMRADEHSPRGWRAPYYNAREPALSVALVAQAPAVTFWTLLGPAPHTLAAEGPMLTITTAQWRGSVQMGRDQGHALVELITIAGDVNDCLEVR